MRKILAISRIDDVKQTDRCTFDFLVQMDDNEPVVLRISVDHLEDLVGRIADHIQMPGNPFWDRSLLTEDDCFTPPRKSKRRDRTSRHN
jgi:hypothetical protein